MEMGTVMKGIYMRIGFMGLGNTIIIKDLYMRGSFRTRSRMGMERRGGRITLRLKGSIRMERRKELELLSGVMALVTKGSFKKIKFKVMGHISGLMVTFILDNGWITKCMEGESITEIMERFILEIIIMIRDMGKVSYRGLVGKGLLENEHMENRLEREYLYCLMEILNIKNYHRLISYYVFLISLVWLVLVGC
jgi:hypothetical protein